jgi:hypothetical protein
MRIEKNFNAVKMMREIRDRLSKEFINMSYEDQKRYIKEGIKKKARTSQSTEKNTYYNRIDIIVTIKLDFSFRWNDKRRFTMPFSHRYCHCENRDWNPEKWLNF